MVVIVVCGVLQYLTACMCCTVTDWHSTTRLPNEI